MRALILFDFDGTLACILATAFTLWDRRDDFSILSDYIYTTATDFTKEDVLKIMKRNFGDCVKKSYTSYTLEKHNTISS